MWAIGNVIVQQFWKQITVMQARLILNRATNDIKKYIQNKYIFNVNVW